MKHYCSHENQKDICNLTVHWQSLSLSNQDIVTLYCTRAESELIITGTMAIYCTTAEFELMTPGEDYMMN